MIISIMKLVIILILESYIDIIVLVILCKGERAIGKDSNLYII